MRITEISVQKINVPLEAPLLWSGGTSRAWTRAVVRMQTDEGIEGIGETVGWNTAVDQIHALSDFFIGQDPFDREKILRNFWYVPFYQGMPGKYAAQALETCCFDIMGKATGRPVCQLLGGRFRTTIPMIAYMFYRARNAEGWGGEETPAEIVRHTQDVVNRTGCQTIKLKGGVFPPQDEYDAVAALRDAFPTHAIRFDPNSLWSVETGVRFGRKFEQLDLEWFEDPVWGIEGMSRVARVLDIPLATNQCCVQLDQLPTAIRSGAIDVQLLDVHDWGGITATMKAAATCQVFQVGLGIHSGGEAGISTALQLQIAAALPVLPYAVDSHYHHQTADVITVPHQYADGCFALPPGPGLGVEIDEDQLARLVELNENEGDRVFYGHDDHEQPRFMGMW